MTEPRFIPAPIDLPLIRRGKVRDLYDLGDLLLLVATDRVSAFDVVLPTPIPTKGAILTRLAAFWFERSRPLIANHVIAVEPPRFPPRLRNLATALGGRAMLVRKAERIDVECVVRGYLAGSAWAEYRAAGTVAGEPIVAGLREASALPSPIFTPAVKHDRRHDQNITRAELSDIFGGNLATRLEAASLALYDWASAIALARGLILADTKFEFGFVDGELTVIDEMLTPDSSRFWDAATHEPGREQASFDKQPLRDWLSGIGWNKQPPGPDLPDDVVAATLERYREAERRLTENRPL